MSTVLQIPGITDPTLQQERLYLGCVMHYPEVINALQLTADDLLYAEHRELMILLLDRHERRYNIDPASIIRAVFEMRPQDRERMPRWLRSTEFSSAALMGTITGYWPEAMPALLREMRARARAKRLDGLMSESRERIANGEAPEDVAADITDRAANLSTVSHEIEAIEDLSMSVLSRLEGERDGSIAPIIPSGIPEWDGDEHFLGISTEGLTLILGASGMGKTSVINRLAYGMAARGTPILLHGTETTAQRRTIDIAFALANVGRRQWIQACRDQDGEWLHRAWDNIFQALDKISRLPLRISGSGATVEQVAARARAMHGQGRLGALIVDFLQDFVFSPGVRGDKVVQVGHASQTLKDLSAHLDVPVVAGAQVSGEKGGGIGNKKAVGDRRPEMWDVQWSSKAHQDSEEVFALYRADFYAEMHPNPQDFYEHTPNAGNPGVIEVISRKRRSGAKTTLELVFDVPSKWVGARTERVGHVPARGTNTGPGPNTGRWRDYTDPKGWDDGDGNDDGYL